MWMDHGRFGNGQGRWLVMDSRSRGAVIICVTQELLKEPELCVDPSRLQPRQEYQWKSTFAASARIRSLYAGESHPSLIRAFVRCSTLLWKSFLVL